MDRFLLRIGKLDEKIPEQIKYLLVLAMATFDWYKNYVLNILVALDVRFLYDTEGDNGMDFKSQMVVVLFVTTFLSQTIIGLRVLLYGPYRLFGKGFKDAGTAKKVSLWFVFFLLCPIAPAIVIYLSTRCERNIRKKEKRLLNMFRYISSLLLRSPH